MLLLVRKVTQYWKLVSAISKSIIDAGQYVPFGKGKEDKPFYFCCIKESCNWLQVNVDHSEWALMGQSE